MGFWNDYLPPPGEFIASLLSGLLESPAPAHCTHDDDNAQRFVGKAMMPHRERGARYFWQLGMAQRVGAWVGTIIGRFPRLPLNALIFLCVLVLLRWS